MAILNYWYSSTQQRENSDKIRQLLIQAGQNLVGREIPGFTKAVALETDPKFDRLLEFTMSTVSKKPHGTKFTDIELRGTFEPQNVITVLSELNSVPAYSYQGIKPDYFLSTMKRVKGVCERKGATVPLIEVEAGSRDALMDQRLENLGFTLLVLQK